MNILVLGGAGFLGSHIVKKLIADNHNVSIYTRTSNAETSIKTTYGNLSDSEKLLEALDDIEIVIHSISSTVPATSAADPIKDINENLIGTLVLLEAMKKKGINKIIYLSSGGTVYGNPKSYPITEDHPLHPISNYGAVKVAIENFLFIESLKWGLKPIIFRPSNPYGQGQKNIGSQGLISTAINAAFTKKEINVYDNGKSVRDYIHAQDFASLVSKAVINYQPGTYNAGSGVGHSVETVLRIIEEKAGIEIARINLPIRDFDVQKVMLDITKSRETFTWNPSIDLERGIELQVEWYKGAMHDSSN